MADTPRRVFESSRFSVIRHRTELGDGNVRERDTIEHPGAVAILPLVDDDRVCLIRNDRLAVGKILIELPAGTREPGEDPQATALRELKEETGFTATSMKLLKEFTMSPGILNETMLLYLAQGLTAGKQQLEEQEQISTLVVPWEEAMTMADDGTILDAKTLVGLYFYNRRFR